MRCSSLAAILLRSLGKINKTVRKIHPLGNREVCLGQNAIGHIWQRSVTGNVRLRKRKMVPSIRLSLFYITAHFDSCQALWRTFEAPWHGLGTALDKPATAAEAIKAARLDWTVRKVQLYAGDSFVRQEVRDQFALVRDDLWGQDGGAPLGIVGKDYKPLQNHEAFAFFDGIVGKGKAIYHTAGVLRNGQRVWMLAKLPGEIRVVGDDITEKYLLLSNNHDGHGTVQVKFTPIRVVCQNTLTMALSQGGCVRVAHTANLTERLAKAAKLLGIIDRRYASLAAGFQAMAQVQVNAERLDKYLAKVFPEPFDPKDERAAARVARDRHWAAHFFVEGKEHRRPGVAGTLWAAYNGVTEYVDHRVGKEQTPDKRLNSIWFGDGYLAKARAYRVAETMARAGMN